MKTVSVVVLLLLSLSLVVVAEEACADPPCRAKVSSSRSSPTLVKAKIVSLHELSKYGPVTPPAAPLKPLTPTQTHQYPLRSVTDATGTHYQLNLTALAEEESLALAATKNSKTNPNSSHQRNQRAARPGKLWTLAHAARLAQQQPLSALEVDSEDESEVEAEIESEVEGETETEDDAEDESEGEMEDEAEFEMESALELESDDNDSNSWLEEENKVIVPLDLNQATKTPAQLQIFLTTLRAQLNKPYVYAAAGPNSFDCSGLVMFAAHAAGLTLPHNSQQQSTHGTAVTTVAARQPGDLIFFGKSSTTIYHVGVFVAANTMIDAPHTGALVRQESYTYWPDQLVPARRLF